MPRLNFKQRQLRALKDLEQTGLIAAVRRRLADDCLKCPPGEVDGYRQRAALSDTFLAELRILVNSGELEYDD